MELSPEEYEAMTGVLTAAIKYAEYIERATGIIGQVFGDMTDRQQDEILEEDSQASRALVEAVNKYRALNDKRSRAAGA